MFRDLSAHCWQQTICPDGKRSDQIRLFDGFGSLVDISNIQQTLNLKCSFCPKHEKYKSLLLKNWLVPLDFIQSICVIRIKPMKANERGESLSLIHLETIMV